MQLTARSRKIRVSADGTGIVSWAGGLLDRGLEEALERWRAPRAVHSPGKSSPISRSRWRWAGTAWRMWRCCAGPGLSGPVASDPVVSRLVARLADAPRALKAIRAARAAARARAWDLARQAAPGAGGGLVTVDIDATLVTACPEKEQAAATWKMLAPDDGP